jgi:hypothetical protein
MTDEFTMSANAHHPRLKWVHRQDDGALWINLGGTGYAHVALLVTDEEWRALVRDVDREIARIDGERVAEGAPEVTEAEWLGNGDEVQVDVLDRKDGWRWLGDSTQKCPECDHWAANADYLTEHVFAQHPEAVGR